MILRRTWKAGFVAVILCQLFLHSCQNGSPLNPDWNPEGTMVAYDGCKNAGGGALSATFTSSNNSEECLEYNYGGNVLRLKHINAAFNCCLDDIVGSVSIEDNIIRIESEGKLANGSGCHCNCLYDVEFEIRDLSPSRYVIVCTTFINSMEIDLRKVASGRFCEPRSSYPWN